MTAGYKPDYPDAVRSGEIDPDDPWASEPPALSHQPVGSVTPPDATALQLAEVVLSMQLATDKGLVARRLARAVLGIADHGDAPNVVPITTNGTTRLVPRDEPVFLIRGQDAVGGDAVRAWASMAQANGADQRILDTARQHAALMDAWPKKKTPDLPSQGNRQSGSGT